MPDENRFRRVVLEENLYNPMAIEITGDGSIYLIQTDGKLKRINPYTHTSKLLGTVRNSDNGEFGLIGMALDPRFGQNHWVYLQYFLPDIPEKVAQVSRFTIVNDSLDQSTEKKLLNIPYDNTCCHTAGAMSFDSKNNLYFSTGDNTTAFETNYSPHDERPGHEIANDMRAAANSMDLRGKICRIHPEDNGTYSVPGGNLFSDNKKGRPEIYVMGCRNAYRIYVDKTTDILYWGEIGPDAGVDSSRGPRGYDEFNIATSAGNYGWPLFIGNNIPYPHVDFSTGQVLEKFDPAHPVNPSRLNTGAKDLPPAHPATIYYPYSTSDRFPSLGEGARAAIGGPIYHYDASMASEIKFPAYFNKGWFIGDWMRNWLKVARLDDHQQLEKLEDLMPSAKFNKPIDLVFSPKDGALYMLEFGVAWGPNPEARLVRIEYNGGNRSPMVRLQADASSGRAPLTVAFSGRGSFDYDNDSLQYHWEVDGREVGNKGVEEKFSFSEAGIHRVALTVTDVAGASARNEKIIKVGNTAPQVSIDLPNNTFYWDTLHYRISVRDNEDGELGKGIGADSVAVSLQYEPRTAGLRSDDGQLIDHGEVLLNENDCKGCHSLKDKSIGPAFFQVAKRYGALAENDDKIVNALADKIISGGGGVWGETKMSAHPQLVADQTRQIVRYILSLNTEKPPVKKIAVAGELPTGKGLVAGKEGFYVIQASYRDRGGASIGPLTDTAHRVLRFNRIYAEDFTALSDMKLDKRRVSAIHGSYAVIRDVDLTGVHQLQLHVTGSGGNFELHIDSLNGARVAGFAMSLGAKEPQDITAAASATGLHDLYLTYTNKELRFQNAFVEWLAFKP